MNARAISSTAAPATIAKRVTQTRRYSSTVGGCAPPYCSPEIYRECETNAHQHAAETSENGKTATLFYKKPDTNAKRVDMGTVTGLK